MIREANSNDAEGIAKVHVQSWGTTYKGILPKDYLKNLSYEKRTELWESNIINKTNYILVVENNEGKIIGFSSAEKNESSTVKNIGNLTSIYLLEEYQGKGIGKELFKNLFRYFKEMKYEKVFVEVLEDNNTRYFYEYYGAILVQIEQIEMGKKKLNEFIYEWNDVEKVLDKLER